MSYTNPSGLRIRDLASIKIDAAIYEIIEAVFDMAIQHCKNNNQPLSSYIANINFLMLEVISQMTTAFLRKQKEAAAALREKEAGN